MRVYLSGPMTGVPACNFPAFDEACAKLRDAGHSVISPHEQDSLALQTASRASVDGVNTIESTPGESLGRTLGNDVKVVIDDVEAIVLLNCWERSRGSRLEVYAGLLYGRDFYYFDRTAENGVYPLNRATVRKCLKENMP